MVTTAALAPPTTLRTDDLARATAALPTLRQGEAAALAQLSPVEQARYATVSATLQNPLEHAALIELLAEGALGSRDSKGGTLLSTLATLAAPSGTVLSPSLSPETLVRQLTLELAQPSRINQGNSNLCGATAIGVLLASTRPAEYARVVAGLASPAGTVELANGTLSRIEGTDGREPPGRWERSLPQRLLAPALTDFGNGALLGYDNATDLNTLLGLPLFPGALPSAVSRMLEGVLGLESTSEGSLVMSPDAQALERAVSTIDRVPVPALMHFGARELGDLHWVLLQAADAAEVSFVNSAGSEQHMPRAEFTERLQALVLPAVPSAWAP